MIGLLGISRDISDRKRAEQEHREHEAKLTEAVRLARLGYWSRDVATGQVTWSGMLYDIFGVEPNAFGKTLESFLTLVHPDDRERVGQRIIEVESRLETFEHTYRILVNNEVRVIHEMGRVIGSDSGHAQRIVGTARDITESTRSAEALRMRDRAIQAVSQGILITDCQNSDHPIIFASEGFERITGYRAQEVIGRNCRFLQGKNTDPATVTKLRLALAEGKNCSVEILNYRKDGTPFWNNLTISPVLDDDSQLTHFIGIQEDVTARRSLEEQFRQAQKMEAVGQLAGGVAHDFNNLLTIINGYSEILLQRLPPDDPNLPFITEISNAGKRSSELTRRLLAFSRQQVVTPRVLDLNESVRETDKMLRRLIGEDIELVTMLDPKLGSVRADPGQVEQVLMNLALNARDAMPQGGQLTIETRNVDWDDSYSQTHLATQPGPYVLLSMTDTGTGVPLDIRSKIFEPFFTTKGPGKGTGLGLSTVYGIVKQSGGHISLYTEVGIGTTFKVYLPRVSEPVETKRWTDRPTIPRGSETVLLVEDDDGVRSFTKRMLRNFGYTVLEAGDGNEAARISMEFTNPIHLLITDVVMQGAGGRVVAARVAARHPHVKILFVSGYTDDAVVRHGILEEKIHFLAKPFSPTDLAIKVRQVLDQK